MEEEDRPFSASPYPYSHLAFAREEESCARSLVSSQSWALMPVPVGRGQ